MDRNDGRGRGAFNDLLSLLHVAPLESGRECAVQPAFAFAREDDAKPRAAELFAEGLRDGKVDLALFRPRDADHARIGASVTRVDHDRENTRRTHGGRYVRKTDAERNDGGKRGGRRNDHPFFDGKNDRDPLLSQSGQRLFSILCAQHAF